MNKKLFTIGCCGLDCGLCPRFYTEGSSRCPGCCGVDFENKHPSCSFITCCTKKKNLEVCGECNDFPCIKFAKETGDRDSFLTHRRVIQNQNFIKDSGIGTFIEQQKKRMALLQTLLKYYVDGNCKSFFCLAATLLSLKSLNESLLKAEKEIQAMSVGKEELKVKAKIMRNILNQLAAEENEELKLRKGKK